MESLRAVRAAEVIILAADAGAHGVRSRNIDTAHGILDHLIMPRVFLAWERGFVEFPQGLPH
jgi:hypothetical protein